MLHLSLTSSLGILIVIWLFVVFWMVLLVWSMENKKRQLRSCAPDQPLKKPLREYFRRKGPARNIDQRRI